MNIPARPLRVLHVGPARDARQLLSTAAGPVVTVNKQPASNKGFEKTWRKCVACGGSGTQCAEDSLYRIAICGACNGRGYVREWRKEQ